MRRQRPGVKVEFCKLCGRVAAIAGPAGDTGIGMIEHLKTNHPEAAGVDLEARRRERDLQWYWLHRN